MKPPSGRLKEARVSSSCDVDRLGVAAFEIAIRRMSAAPRVPLPSRSPPCVSAIGVLGISPPELRTMALIHTVIALLLRALNRDGGARQKRRGEHVIPRERVRGRVDAGLLGYRLPVPEQLSVGLPGRSVELAPPHRAFDGPLEDPRRVARSAGPR